MRETTDFRRWVIRKLDGEGCWTECYEPRRGGGTGIADIQVAVNGVLVPIELKVGVVEFGLVYPREVRADQLGWHNRLNDNAGVMSLFLTGVEGGDGKLVGCFACGLRPMLFWKKGILIADGAMFDKENFGSLFFAYMVDRLKEWKGEK